VSHKSPKIALLIQSLEGGRFDPHYLGYFECFNQQRFFEAHEVLEELWLPLRRQAQDLFYKGLIQLAGAFVHIQKGRPQPALALFRLARENLGKYPAVHESLDLVEVKELIDTWMKLAAEADVRTSFESIQWPRLALVPAR